MPLLEVECPSWPQEWKVRYRQEGCWEGITFGELLRKQAQTYGERTALIGGGERISYRELDRRADRLASGLAGLGIRQGDRVVVQLPNIPAFVELLFALFRIGAVPVMALPSHRSHEIVSFITIADAVAYIIPDRWGGTDYRELAAEAMDRSTSLRHVIVAGEPGPYCGFAGLYQEPGTASWETVSSTAVALFQLSGGSTGLPKLIPRTHDDYICSLKYSVRVCGLDPSSVYLAVLPMAHNFPLSSPGVLGVLYAGGTVVLSPGASPDEAFPLLAKERVTITALVPPLALIWLEAAAARKAEATFETLRVLQVGGAKFSAEAAQRVRSVLGCTLQQVFGMAEGLVNYTRLDDPEELILHTQGRPMSEHDEIRIVDDEDREVEPGATGHLLTRGPYTIRGYYRAAEHNARSFTDDGFYRTGDLVRLTPEGYLVVEGRAKDQINRGGEKVAAEEVENLLLAHPSVHDAAVVAMPDDYLGERTCAFIIPRGPAPAAAVLKTFLREKGLAAYKIPDRVEYTGSFPQTALGKVSKKDLRHTIARILMDERKR
ncbi:(2,3-dihydroxybenzoyl)adenylate synthase [Gorillibacterium sp. sgz5001074]|uniref:(2,3-dihydroxybenzoyl)adenylate synthase n=1 Tax=Gorillibacterium sp. sgz5001074 TaxID=3446695 RepID=UPI003F6627FE